MSDDDSINVQDLIAMIRRRRKMITRTIAVCVVTGIVLAFGTPPLYMSKGTIMIERAEISDDIVRPTHERDFDTNLTIQRISDSVLTRQTLSMLLKTHDLYPSLREKGSDGVARRELTSSIEIIPLSAEDMPLGSERTETVAFEVMFFHSKPETARDVARHLIQLFTEEHYKRRTAVAQDTISFLTLEAEKLEQNISEIESALADFKQRHAGALPELMDMNLQAMERTERELELVERDIRTQQQNESMLEAQLAQIDPMVTVYTEDGRPVQGSAERLKLLEREYIRISSLYSPEHPDRIRLNRELDQLRQSGSNSIQRQALISTISKKEEELQQLRDRYTDSHPDLIQAERHIAELRSQLNSLPVDSSTRHSAEPTNPDYLAVKVQIDAARKELLALSGRRVELRRKISLLESQVRLTPQVEREYSELTRDYETAKDKYNEITNKLSLAQMNLSMETEQKAERFSVYKNAGYPNEPIRPNRPLIFIAAIAVAISASIGLVVLTEALDSSMRGSRDVQEIWDAPPLAVVPYIFNSADRARQVGRFGLVAGALAVWSIGLYISLQMIY